MYVVKNKDLIRAFNLDTMCPASKWYECTPIGVYQLLYDIMKQIRKRYGYCITSENTMLNMFKNVNDKAIDPCKFLCFQSNSKGFVPLYAVSGIYYNTEYQEYEIDPKLTVSKPYNRKKELRKRDNGFRREPVSRSGRYFGRYGRRVSYKNTLLAFDDPDCKEYGIKGYRKRRVIDPWDIEPVEPYSHSWKDHNKTRKQWARHKKHDEYKSVKELTTKYVLKKNNIKIDEENNLNEED